MTIGVDGEGRPNTASDGTNNIVTATYDALGRMVEKGVGSTFTQFVFRPSGANLAVYSGSLSKGTVPLPGGNTAIYNNSGLAYIRHTDWLGSSRFATTWAHAVYSKEAYAPFGETYNEAGTPDRSFTGQDQDVQTGAAGGGVYDFLFRKYDPSAGRWLSPDPAGWGVVDETDPQSLDRYAYVENQPMNAVDPAGLFMNGMLCGASCDDPPAPPPTCADFGDCQQPSPGNPSAGNSNGGSGAAPSNLQKAKAIAQCAANVGNSLSLAALLPQGAPTFLQNALGNDFSTISNLVTGPNRGGAVISVAQGKLTSTAVTALGNIPTGSSLLFIEGEGAAQNTIEVTPTVATSLLGEAAGALVTSVAEAKLALDGATYLYGVLKCSNVVP